MKRIHLALAAAFPLALGGCVTPVGHVGLTSTGEVLRDIERPGDAGKRRVRYEAAVKALVVPKEPFAAYQKRLREELESLPARPGLALSQESNFGIPSFYDMQLEAAAQVRFGLARLDLDAGRPEDAARWAQEGLEIVRDRALSPYLLAKNSRDGYSLLQRAREAAGKRGKARVAKLNVDMLDDYLSSPRGRRDFSATRAAEESDVVALREVSRYLAVVDQDRSAQKEAMILKTGLAMGVVAQQAGKLAQAGRVSPQASTMARFQNGLATINMLAIAAALKAPQARAPDGTAPTSAAVLSHAVDPESGGSPEAAVRSFARDARELSGNGEVARVAGEVEGMSQQMERARSSKTAFENAERYLKGIVELAASLENAR